MNIELLKTLGKIKKYNKGNFICTENETGETAYLLLQGDVDVVLGSFTNSIRTVTQLQPGTIFGEMSLLENKPRNASVIACDDNTLVLEIEKSNFLSILTYDKEIAWNLLCTLMDRMEKLMLFNNLKDFVFVAGYKKNRYYMQLTKLSKEQFGAIIDKDGEYAIKLLKFLSSSLAEMNEELMRQEEIII